MDAIETTESLWDNYAASLAASGYDPLTKDLLSWLVITAKKEKWTLKQTAEAVGYSYTSLQARLDKIESQGKFGRRK